MEDCKAHPPSSQAPKVHHLTALSLDLGAKPKTPRKPRRKSVRALIEAATKADLPVAKLNPDGSVEIGQKADANPLPANGHSNPWDEVLHHGDD